MLIGTVDGTSLAEWMESKGSAVSKESGLIVHTQVFFKRLKTMMRM
jgi:hypothetical protein